MRWALFVCVAGFGLGALASAPAHAQSRACGNAFREPDQPGYAIRAAGMRCSAARYLTRRIILGGYPYGPNQCSRSSPCRYLGYTCYAYKTVDLTYLQRCRRGTRRFDFGGGS